MKEGDDPASRLANLQRDALALWAEYARCSDEQERRTILGELRTVDAQRAKYEAQAETQAQLPDLWSAIYGDQAGYLALFSGLRPDKRLGHPQARYFPYPDRLDQAQAWVSAAAAADREVYQCAHLLTERRRRKEAAAPLAALYVDWDGGAYDSQAVPPASLTVESSPGRYQLYWYLTEPTEPAAAEALNRRLAYTLGADRSGWDLTQLLRVPGTLNHKYPDAPLVKIAAHPGRRYDLATIEQPLAELPLFRASVEHPTTPATPPASLDALPLTTTARRILVGELVKRRADGDVDRSASLLQMARVLAGTGMDAAAIAVTLAERDLALGWRKYSDREDAQRQYERLAALVTRPRR